MNYQYAEAVLEILEPLIRLHNNQASVDQLVEVLLLIAGSLASESGIHKRQYLELAERSWALPTKLLN